MRDGLRNEVRKIVQNAVRESGGSLLDEFAMTYVDDILALPLNPCADESGLRPQVLHDALVELEWRCRRAEEEFSYLAAPDGTVAVPFNELRKVLNYITPDWPRDSDTHPKDGDVKQAPLVSSAGRRHRPTTAGASPDHPELEGD